VRSEIPVGRTVTFGWPIIEICPYGKCTKIKQLFFTKGFLYLLGSAIFIFIFISQSRKPTSYGAGHKNPADHEIRRDNLTFSHTHLFSLLALNR
jgi:hypothetical protein